MQQQILHENSISVVEMQAARDSLRTFSYEILTHVAANSSTDCTFQKEMPRSI